MQSRVLGASSVPLQEGVELVEDDLLLAEARQVVRGLSRRGGDRPESMLEQRDLEARVREDAAAVALDRRDRLRVLVSDGAAREDPDRNPGRLPSHAVRDAPEFLPG